MRWPPPKASKLTFPGSLPSPLTHPSPHPSPHQPVSPHLSLPPLQGLSDSAVFLLDHSSPPFHTPPNPNSSSSRSPCPPPPPAHLRPTSHSAALKRHDTMISDIGLTNLAVRYVPHPFSPLPQSVREPKGEMRLSSRPPLPTPPSHSPRFATLAALAFASLTPTELSRCSDDVPDCRVHVCRGE